MKNNLHIANRKRIEIVAYGLLFAILIGGALWLCFDLVRERNRIIDDRTQIAIEKSKFMSQWLRNIFLSSDYVLRDVREKVKPNDLIHAKPEEIERLCTWLGEKAATVPGLYGVAIYDSNLIYRAGNERRIIGYHSNQKVPTSRTDKIEDKIRLQYMPTEKSATKRPTILLYRWIFSQDGQFMGGSSAAVYPDFAQHWIQAFKIGPNDVLALMDEEGTLLALNPATPEALGKKTNFLQEQSNNSKTSGRASAISLSSFDGVKRIYGITRMEELPIVLVVGYDLNNTLEGWRHRAWQISCGFIVLIGLALFAMRAYIKSLHQGEELLKLATTDGLTGISNRRVLFEAGEREAARINRYGGALSMLILDIDHFKKINDTWGHSSGDRVIKVMAQTISTCIRNQDMVGRIGGEEFVVLLPETGQDGALVIAERVRMAIQDTTEATADNGSIVRFTVSIGLSTVVDGETFQGALDRADKGLYKAKEGGRNMVVIY